MIETQLKATRKHRPQRLPMLMDLVLNMSYSYISTTYIRYPLEPQATVWNVHMQNADKNESTTNNNETTRQVKSASSPARQAKGKVRPPATSAKQKPRPAEKTSSTKAPGSQAGNAKMRVASGKQTQGKPAATPRTRTTKQAAAPKPVAPKPQPTAKAEQTVATAPVDAATKPAPVSSAAPQKALKEAPLSVNQAASKEQSPSGTEPQVQPTVDAPQGKAPQQVSVSQTKAPAAATIPQVEPTPSASTASAATSQAAANTEPEDKTYHMAEASNQPKPQPAGIRRGVTSKVAALTRMIKAQPATAIDETAQETHTKQDAAPSKGATSIKDAAPTQPKASASNATAPQPKAPAPDATAPQPAAHFANEPDESNDDPSLGSAIKAGAEALGGVAKAIGDTTTVLVENLPLPAIEDVPGALTMKERLTDAKDWITVHLRTPLGIVLLVVAAIYVAGSLFFSSHFLPGTTVNGTNMSMRSTKAAVAMAQNDEENGYSTHVDGDGVDLVIKGQDISFAVDTDAYTQGVSEHFPSWAWPIYLFQQRDYQVSDGVSYNTRELEKILTPAIEAVNKNSTKPENATIEFDASQNSFVATDENGGTEVSLKNTVSTVSQGVSTLQSHIELGKDELTQPSISANSEHMQEAIQKANELKDAKFDLTVKGKAVETVDPDLVRSWLTVDGAYNVVGNIDLITEWTRGELSAEVDTVGTARTYTRTSDGKRIDVFGGTYGWNVDGVALAELIAKQLAEGSSESIEIPMQSKAEVYVHGRQDWGPRYLDVDLSEQYVCFFDKDSNIIMQSECVSGNLAENNETVTGVFTIESKASPMTLIGLDEDGDGEPDYENEVDFWMPFFGGYGLHDALWRNYFGGEAYLYDGSHGCVNLPYYAAAQLYELIEVGDVVVVHF